MSISPFSARPVSPQDERRRARLVVLLVALGLAASLLAYAISPSVRHAVGHAAHSVNGAVGHVLDRDNAAHPKPAKVAPRKPGHAQATPSGPAAAKSPG
jgi:hypothetical protein